MTRGKEKIRIRRMTEEDLQGVKNIDRALVGPERAPSWPLGAEAHWWVYRPMLNFVAEIDGEVVGFLLGDIRGAEYGTDISGWIDMMGVAPEHQRRRIGKRLVEAFCEECQRNGVRVRVIIRQDDQRLIGFWTSVGFQRGNLVSYER
jgi:ribosomal protein S18 acetylase RimI-like enzyme